MMSEGLNNSIDGKYASKSKYAPYVISTHMSNVVVRLYSMRKKAYGRVERNLIRPTMGDNGGVLCDELNKKC